MQIKCKKPKFLNQTNYYYAMQILCKSWIHSKKKASACPFSSNQSLFMSRKQRESLPWRRVVYLILIVIKPGEFLLWISLIIINALRSYIKHSKECLIWYPNTSKLVEKIRFHLVFSTHFLVFRYWMDHSSCVWYITSKRVMILILSYEN